MAVIGAAARLDRKTTDPPQLPLGAKSVRCLQNAKRRRRADRADRGNSAEPFPGAVLVALCQQFLPNFLAQCSQRIKLLEVERGPEPHTWFSDLTEPSHPVQPRADLCSAPGNAPPAVQRFHAGHDLTEDF